MSSEYRENKSCISADHPPMPSDKLLLISAISEHKRLKEASTISPSIMMTEATTPAQLLTKLKQIG